jgi:nucleoid-associated protein YgaU
MKRFKETRIQRVFGRGDVYKISLTDSFKDNTQMLTTYTPKEKERLDLIADKFYDDSSKWFIIARANKEVRGNIYAPPGKALVIPRID